MSREQQLAEAFVEAADTLADEFDIFEFLQSLAARFVQLLDVNAAGLLLADERGGLELMAASAEYDRLVTLFDAQAEAPAATGLVAVHALPMRLRSIDIGAVNLLSTDTRALTDADLRTGQALADVATIGLLAQRSRQEAERQAAQLRSALNSRVVIEQAKGILAEHHKISIDAAFDALRRHSRSNNLRLPQVAYDLVSGALEPIGLLPSG